MDHKHRHKWTRKDFGLVLSLALELTKNEPLDFGYQLFGQWRPVSQTLESGRVARGFKGEFGVAGTDARGKIQKVIVRTIDKRRAMGHGWREVEARTVVEFARRKVATWNERETS